MPYKDFLEKTQKIEKRERPCASPIFILFISYNYLEACFSYQPPNSDNELESVTELLHYNP